MKTQFIARASAAALGTAMCFAASPAMAQNEPMAAGSDERDVIVVTGSFIRGTPEDAALPVDVFSSEDLDQNGISSPLEFIKDLPSVGSVLGDTNQFSTASQGFQGAGSINLRGLGSTRTLVLLNGRRTITSPGDGFADTNMIPLFALDRIEILKDGAAATYGSDAIGGVANFVTRQNWEGVEVAGDYEFIDGSNDDYNVSALIGHTWGDANFIFGAGYQHRSELSTQEREFTQLPYAVNPSGWSVLGNPGTYLPLITGGPAAGTFLAGFTLDGNVPGTCQATNGVVGSTGPGGTGLPVCRFTYIPFDNLVEHQNRYQIYGQMDVDLSDTLAFHAEGLWAYTYQRGRYSPSFPPTQGPNGSGSVFAFSVPDHNPGYQGFINQSGLAGGPADPSAPGSPASIFPSGALIALFRPLANGGNPLTGGRGGQIGIARIEAWRASGGLDWDIDDDFRVSLYNTFIRSDRSAYVTDIVGSRLQNALNGLGGPNCNPATGTPGVGDCMYFNPFSNSFPGNPATGQTNPGFIPGNENSLALLDWLLVPSGTDQREEQWIVDLIFSGETGIEIGGGGPIAYAFGAQYRQSDYRSVPLNRVTNLNNNPCFRENDVSCVGTPTEGVGPFVFLGGFNNVQLEQDVYALFAEVNVPIGDRLEITGAIRFEDYGGSVGSTVNPKASLRWEPTDWLVLRGSVGTTFRGPLPVQVSTDAVTSLAGIQAAGNNFKSVDIFGNPTDLGPETAFTYNIGAIVDYAGFTASVDYWSYDFDDRITTTPGQAIANTVANGPGTGTQLVNCASPLVDLITFSGGACVQGTTTGGDISRVRTDWVNGPSVKTSGFDFALDYTTDLGPGVFSIGGQATHILDYEVDDFVFRGVLLQTGYDADGFSNFFRDPGTVSKWRANGYVNYNFGNLNLRYTIQHIAGVTDDRCVNVNPCASTPEFGGTNFAAEIDSYTQHDFHVAYDLPFDFMDTQLQFSIENFTDEDPAAARLELGYNPFIGNPLGRVYRIGARVRF